MQIFLCLSSIILSPLNGYVKMSPYETGDICIEPERIATSGGDFILREGEPGVSQTPPTIGKTTKIPVAGGGGGGLGPPPAADAPAPVACRSACGIASCFWPT